VPSIVCSYYTVTEIPAVTLGIAGISITVS